MGKAKINYRLYASLLVMGLCPAIYQAVRIFFLGQMPDPGAYSIAGQLSWVQLLYEIVQETVLLPLYFFLGQVVSDKAVFGNRVRSGLWLTAGIWTALAVALSAFARPLLGWMAAAPDIIDASAAYIRIESFANIFATLFSFALVALVTLSREKWLYVLTGARLVFSILLDCLLLSNLPFSLRIGVNGIGWSNLAANGILFAVALVLLVREGVPLGGKLSFGWAREFFRVGSLSGLESFVRNFTYMVMVVRMINVVQEQGLYWTANNFIWGWLLLPITQLGELVKRDVATAAGSLRQKVRSYAVLTAGICAFGLFPSPSGGPLCPAFWDMPMQTGWSSWYCFCWASMSCTPSRILYMPCSLGWARPTISWPSLLLPTPCTTAEPFCCTVLTSGCQPLMASPCCLAGGWSLAPA